MLNILTKIPLKVTLEKCRTNKFKFQTVPGNRRSESKKLSMFSASVRILNYMETTKYSKTSLLLLLQKENARNKGGKKRDSNSQFWNNWPFHLWKVVQVRDTPAFQKGRPG